MGANIATVDKLLKDVYGPGIKNQLPNETPLLDMFDKDCEGYEFTGREYVVATKVGRNWGAYWTAEGGAIPTAGNVQVENFRIPLRYLHGSIQLTKQAMSASQSNPGAFARAMKLEMDGLVETIKRKRAVALSGDGRGILAFVNGDPATGTTITVDSPGGVAGATHGNRFINKNMYVCFVDPVAGALRAGGTRQVTAVAAAGTSFTIGAAANAAVADNDYIVQAYGSDASLAIGNTDWQHQPEGFLSLVDNGTYKNLLFGLSRTTFPMLNSTVIASAGALSADLLQRAIDVTYEVGGGEVKYHVMHSSTRRAYLAMMEADRRYSGSDLLSPNAGTNAATGKYDAKLGFGPGDNIKCDPFVPFGFWFGIDPSSAVHFSQEEGWVDDDGSVLVRSASAVDTFDAQYRLYENYGILNPNKCFVVSGITSNVAIAHLY